MYEIIIITIIAIVLLGLYYSNTKENLMPVNNRWPNRIDYNIKLRDENKHPYESLYRMTPSGGIPEKIPYDSSNRLNPLNFSGRRLDNLVGNQIEYHRKKHAVPNYFSAFNGQNRYPGTDLEMKTNWRKMMTNVLNTKATIPKIQSGYNPHEISLIRGMNLTNPTSTTIDRPSGKLQPRFKLRNYHEAGSGIPFKIPIPGGTSATTNEMYRNGENQSIKKHATIASERLTVRKQGSNNFYRGKKQLINGNRQSKLNPRVVRNKFPRSSGSDRVYERFRFKKRLTENIHGRNMHTVRTHRPEGFDAVKSKRIIPGTRNLLKQIGSGKGRVSKKIEADNGLRMNKRVRINVNKRFTPSDRFNINFGDRMFDKHIRGRDKTMRINRIL